MITYKAKIEQHLWSSGVELVAEVEVTGQENLADDIAFAKEYLDQIAANLGPYQRHCEAEDLKMELLKTQRRLRELGAIETTNTPLQIGSEP